MERRRVVITGLGAVTPIGLTAAESWQAVKDGVCGIAPITQFDPTDLKVHLAAEVKGFVPENYMSKPEAKRMGRFTQMAVVSAKEALDGASLSPAASAASPSRRQSTTRARRRAGTGSLPSISPPASATWPPARSPSTPASGACAPVR